MYTVNGEKFNSYFGAIEAAKKAGAEVIEAATGIRRWAPAAAVTQKKLRRYYEHKAAYEAQERAKAA